MQCPHCQAALTEKDRFCGNCGQPVAAPAAATAALPTAAIATPPGPASTWSMPSLAWLVLGLAFAGLLGGGALWLSGAFNPPKPQLTAAQEEELRKNEAELRNRMQSFSSIERIDPRFLRGAGASSADSVRVQELPFSKGTTPP